MVLCTLCPTVGSELENARPKGHLAVYRCNFPGFYDARKPDTFWACSSATSDPEFPVGSECAETAVTILSHAHGQTPVPLPPGFGYEVGPDVRLDFLVLAVHFYPQPRPWIDHEALLLTLALKSTDSRMRDVGQIRLESMDLVPAHSIKSLENFLVVQQNISLIPLQYSLHTHAAGSRAEMWIVSRNGVWTLLGRATKHSASDQETDVFHSILKTELGIRQGDIIALRCLIKNGGSAVLEVRRDEMCIGYLIYSSESSEKLRVQKVESDNRSVKAGTKGRSWLDNPILISYHLETKLVE